MIFKAYGKIQNIVIFKEKKKAVIEFLLFESAEAAVNQYR